MSILVLRTISIVAGLLGLALTIQLMVHGVAPDAEAMKIMSSETAIERFRRQQGTPDNASRSPAKSPLVAEAERYALMVNPPVRPEAHAKPRFARTPPRPEIRPPKVTAKFTLEGTCYNAQVPDASLAFIDEPGKGQHWVRQGDKLGHLTIEEIHDGRIRLRDGQRTEVLYVLRAPKVNLYAETQKEGCPGSGADLSASKAHAPAPRRNAISVKVSSLPPGSLVDGQAEAPFDAAAAKKEMERLAHLLRDLRRTPNSGQSLAVREAEQKLEQRTKERLMKLSRRYMAHSQNTKKVEMDTDGD